MIYSKGSKIIAAILTAALALSPVFVTPISADDGQDVETQASSWRYEDGDIIIDEGLDFEDADTPEKLAAAENADQELLEDYGAQMGSSMREEPAVEPTEEQAEEPAVIPEEEPAEEPGISDPAAEQTENPAAASEEEAAEQTDGEAAEEPVQVQEPAEVQVETAAEAPEAEAPVEVPAVEAPASEEPEVSAKSATALDKCWSWSSGKYVRGPGYLKGIDVSYWQHNINWKKVKASGVDFAILRCGYGANTSSKDDSTFAANVAGCKKYGIPYGVYLYSYANTVSAASDEADHALRLLRANKCNLQYPVYYDLEDKKVAKASNATIVKMANKFCSKLQSNGYPAGVYANLSWWQNKLSGLNNYDRWVAQWANKCTYGREYSIWQCTSSASVSGISGRVDANLLMCPRSKMDSYMKYGRISYYFTTINGKRYLVNAQGSPVTNRFFWFGGYTYAFDQNGVMQTNRKFWIGNAAYILDSQGRAYINKSKTKKKAKYYAKPGSVKKGKLKKGKSFYVIRTSGKWSQMANGYWIKTKYIKKTAIYPEIKPAVTVNYKAKVKKKTRSRSGPSNNYVKKKKFKKNKTVTVIGTYGGWSKVSTGQWLPSSRLKKQ